MSSDISKSTTRKANVNVELRPLKSALSSAGGEMPVMLRITPERFAEAGERPRINLALVLDRSGSMSGTPLEQAKLGAKAAVELLAADDRVSVVTYDDQVDVIVPNMPAADKPRILGAVSNVRSGGTTALHAGWLEGAAQASQSLDPAALPAAPPGSGRAWRFRRAARGPGGCLAGRRAESGAHEAGGDRCPRLWRPLDCQRDPRPCPREPELRPADRQDSRRARRVGPARLGDEPDGRHAGAQADEGAGVTQEPQLLSRAVGRWAEAGSYERLGRDEATSPRRHHRRP
jgi:hypothetical protein